MVKVAKDHGYDSTLFHRVIPQFMIQGGDPDSKNAKPGQMLGNGGLKYTVPAEINDEYYHKRGALGVARDGNPQKAGSASQFYLVVGKKATDEELDRISAQTGRKFSAEQREVYKTIGGTPHLDGNYTVFGEVTEGMDIVDKIALEPRDRSDRPNKDIRMLSVRVMKKKHRFLFF
jgi:peptidyl-prolyl cis-trans isomerase B (cyclophilin B)